MLAKDIPIHKLIIKKGGNLKKGFLKNNLENAAQTFFTVTHAAALVVFNY